MSSRRDSRVTNSGTPALLTTLRASWPIAVQHAFREAEVTIDGAPAGVAPVYPWIFTGGIDPFLWRPIPGVHTLNFEPYRVDLTPFAGVLSNGQQHTVAVNVYNADQYFSATATLLLYQDTGSIQVTGAVTTNTIGQPDPVITENIINNGPAFVRHAVGDLQSRLHGGRLCQYFARPGGYQGRAEHRFHQCAEVLRRTDGSIYDQYVGQDHQHLFGHYHHRGQQRHAQHQAVHLAADLTYAFNGLSPTAPTSSTAQTTRPSTRRRW